MSWLSKVVKENLTLPEDMNSLPDLKRKAKADIIANRAKIIAAIDKELTAPIPEAVKVLIIGKVVDYVVKFVFG